MANYGEDQTVPQLVERRQVPNYWEPQQHHIQLFEVDKSSQEFLGLQAKLQLTLPTANLLRVTRVQNMWLWEKYQFHKDMMALKNKGKVNEMVLYHGSRGANPHVICRGEEGLDIRYSSKGLWGIANYFTENAKYANDYAHSCMTTNERALLFVRVTLGEVNDYGSHTDPELRMPPPLPILNHHLNLFNPLYDSTSGITANTRVYMTYDNTKCYPTHILTYTVPNSQ